LDDWYYLKLSDYRAGLHCVPIHSILQLGEGEERRKTGMHIHGMAISMLLRGGSVMMHLASRGGEGKEKSFVLSFTPF
jgi:hypothetical protein